MLSACISNSSSGDGVDGSLRNGSESAFSVSSIELEPLPSSSAPHPSNSPSPNSLPGVIVPPVTCHSAWVETDSHMRWSGGCHEGPEVEGEGRQSPPSAPLSGSSSSNQPQPLIESLRDLHSSPLLQPSGAFGVQLVAPSCFPCCCSGWASPPRSSFSFSSSRSRLAPPSWRSALSQLTTVLSASYRPRPRHLDFESCVGEP
mmetsp:Transcript_14408/g.25141  ORF Transcript_14408/g.25141 Transcript_14408/m.25141 type:complete len:202 (-) Transcript_14408:199-804(-)